jgi:hypothetical protein
MSIKKTRKEDLDLIKEIKVRKESSEYRSHNLMIVIGS